MNLSHQIKNKAKALGFQKVGISPARALEEGNHLREWLKRGYGGEMSWIGKNAGKRVDPSTAVANASSVISVALNYYTRDKSSYDRTTPRISRYAWGKDYHRVMEKKLRALYEYIISLNPAIKGKIYVDTGPVLEKALAQRAGLGAIGKHTNLITKEYGSWVFLGEIIVDVQLDYDEPLSEDLCGNCSLCIDACPTGAIVDPYILDAQRCISYLSIELRSSISPSLRPFMENMVFGCDICQEVCPWNLSNSVVTSEPDFKQLEANKGSKLKDLLKLTLEKFRTRFRHTAIKRTKWKGLLRNVAVALGNSHDQDSIPSLIEALSHEEPLVRSHAAWALKTLMAEAAIPHLNRALSDEKDKSVWKEIKEILDRFS